MALDFPNNPSHNATATVGTVNYKFDSAAQTWTAIPISTQFDSSTATNLIDSAYVDARTSPSTDSASVISLIDSDYVQARQAAGGIEWQSTIQTGSTFTAQANKAYWTDTTSNTITAHLPASASVGDEIIFVDYARKWNTNNFLIDNGDSTTDLKYQGANDSDAAFNTDGTALHIVYSGATQGWIPINDDPVDVHAVTTSPNPTIEMLIVAGGGGGGGWTGGGGGAGGYRTSTQTIVAGTVITVTVGAGGTGGNHGNVSRGSNGSNSQITGSPATSVTSAGGGGGGGYTSNSQQTPSDGGSGGGAGHRNVSGGSGNVPSTTPSQGNDGGSSSSNSYNMGGGGGAGAVGNDGNNYSSGGEGGAGTANSITGSSVTYAGGGSGAIQSNRSGTGYNPGGAGGGGNGGAYNGNSGSAGTANTGGGGGGDRDRAASAGGSGVVIFKVATAKYSGTTTGSPTVTTSGDYKIIKFTGSGSYTT